MPTLTPKQPPWNISIQVRPGLVIPTLAPTLAGDAPSLPGSPAVLLAGLREREPWPGLVPWLWRAITGRTFGPSLDLRILRAAFRAITPAEHHRLAATLTQGELAIVIETYTRAQVRWLGLVGSGVGKDLDAAFGPAHRDIAAPAPSVPPPAPSMGATGRPRPGSTLVMPGGERVGVPFDPAAFEARYGLVQGGQRLDGTPAGVRKAGG